MILKEISETNGHSSFTPAAESPKKYNFNDPNS